MGLSLQVTASPKIPIAPQSDKYDTSATLGFMVRPPECFLRPSQTDLRIVATERSMRVENTRLTSPGNTNLLHDELYCKQCFSSNPSLIYALKVLHDAFLTPLPN